MFVFILALSAVGPASASDASLQLYGGGNDPDGVPVGQATNHIFYDVTKTFSYSGGPVCLSSQSGQCSPPATDDAVRIFVDGSEVYYEESRTHDYGPVDFSGKLHTGTNQVRIQLIDLMGPSRGGSALWLVPSSGSQTGSLEITAVRAPIGIFSSATMGAAYKVEVEVYNSTNSRLTGKVYLEETGSVGNGDSLSPRKEQTVTLDPGERERLQFEYVHQWSWVQQLSNDCMDAGKILVDVVISRFGLISKALESLDNAISWVDWAKDVRITDARHKFIYEAFVITNGSSSDKVSAEAWVDVPFWSKQLDLLTYWFGLWKGPAYIASGLAVYFRNPGLGQQYVNQGLMILSSSCYSFESATDPDPNYQTIAAPQPIIVPSVESDTGDNKQALLDGLTYLSLQRALYQTTARYEGARAAGDVEWMEIQGQAARRYLVELLYALDAWDASSTAMISADRGNNWQLSPDEVALARSYLSEQGGPPVDTDLLQALDLEESQLSSITGLVSAFLQPDETWPRLSLPGEGLSTVYSEMIAGLNSELTELNGAPIDTTAPVSAIQLDAAVGKNGWFVSDVTVTLTAQDNPGGSGVAGIEWSLDNGRTWTAYNGPFAHSQEGVFHLLVRATDQEGNIEYPPTEADFKVDKTPPVVNVWTDQIQYTRVQPFTVHYSGYDPEPGSGLASLTGEFNGQPVTNGQVIDLFWLDLGQYTLSATGEDYAGWVTTQSKSIQLIATIESLQQTVQRLCQEGYITKSGICKSLLSKLDSALAAQNRGQNKTAVNILLAFQNEIGAQADKSIKPEARALMIMDSNYVIVSLGGKITNK